jgi:hypothetical protein
MAVTHQAIFIQTPKQGAAVIAAANTARDGSGTIVTVCTIGSNGGKVKKVKFNSAQASAAANSAMVGIVWYSLDGGTTWHKKTELLISAQTASVTATAGFAEEEFEDFPCDASLKIGVTQTVYAGVQDRMNVTVDYGDY